MTIHICLEIKIMIRFRRLRRLLLGTQNAPRPTPPHPAPSHSAPLHRRAAGGEGRAGRSGAITKIIYNLKSPTKQPREHSSCAVFRHGKDQGVLLTERETDMQVRFDKFLVSVGQILHMEAR